MTRSKHIQEELQETGPVLAGIPLQNPYKVPAGYFDKLATEVLARIRTEDAGSVKNELESLSPLLAKMDRSMPYAVPEGYFNKLEITLPVKMPRLTHTVNSGGEESVLHPAKVVQLRPAKIFRYAAAAVTIGLIILVAWFYSGEQVATKPTIVLNSDTPAEVQVQKRMEMITESEISRFMDTENFYTLDNPVPDTELAETDVQFMLGEISDQELEQYLRMNQPAKEKYN